VKTIRIYKPHGPWEPIPHSLIRDDRLSLEARAVACFLASQNPDYEVLVGELPKMLRVPNRASGHVGRQTVRACLAELVDAGYVFRERLHVAGRYYWRCVFSVSPEFLARATVRDTTDCPADDCPATDRAASDGPAVARPTVDCATTVRPPVDNRYTEVGSTPDSKTRTQTKPVDGGPLKAELVDGLVFFTPLLGPLLAEARTVLQTAPEGARQALLEEVAAMALRGRVRRPIALLRRLVEKAWSRSFEPTTAKRYARQLDSSRATLGAPSRSMGGGAASAGDIAKHAIEQMRAALGKQKP
jgi:hypothetical protein